MNKQQAYSLSKLQDFITAEDPVGLCIWLLSNHLPSFWASDAPAPSTLLDVKFVTAGTLSCW